MHACIHPGSDVPFSKESVTCPRGCHYHNIDDTCRRDREYYYNKYYDNYYHYGEAKAHAQRYKAVGAPNKMWKFPYFSDLKNYYYSNTASKNPEETTLCHGIFPQSREFLARSYPYVLVIHACCLNLVIFVDLFSLVGYANLLTCPVMQASDGPNFESGHAQHCSVPFRTQT